jgi:D-sedoheptulose 7-phosphate isomerase
MEKPITQLKAAIASSIATKTLILNDESLLQRILDVSKLMAETVKGGNRVLFAGNGGSAADAQHLAAEFVSRFEFDRPGLPALSLSTDTSMITAIGNDYGYEQLFLRQLHAQAREGDLFVGITTSGKSRNILLAFEACKPLGVKSVALCGLGGDLDSIVDHVIRVPSSHTPRIQECHILLGHIMCAYVELNLFEHLKPV